MISVAIVVLLGAVTAIAGSRHRLGAAVSASVFVLSGCTSAPTPPPSTPPTSPTTEATPRPGATPTPVASETTLPSLVASLAPVPRDCSPSGPPDTMALHAFGGGFSDGTVFGRVPVWTVGLPTDGIVHLQPVSSSDGRFPSLKVMWIVGPNETQPVTVTGLMRGRGDPLWFQVYPPNWAADLPSSYTTTLLLDPASSNRGYTSNAGGDWSIWGIGVGARSSGCYSMTVSSSKGAWTIALAVGS